MVRRQWYSCHQRLWQQRGGRRWWRNIVNESVSWPSMKYIVSQSGEWHWPVHHISCTLHSCTSYFIFSSFCLSCNYCTWCIVRGADFRPAYKRSTSLRGVFTDAVCVALSATVTEDIYSDVVISLHLCVDNTSVIALPPDRPNVYLDVISHSCMTLERDLEWLALAVESQQQRCPKTVIFCKSINAVADVYEWLVDRLGEKAFVQGAHSNYNRLVSVFHAHISDNLRQYVMTEFRKPQSIIRLVIATVAFGLGIEIPDIAVVIHWGKLSSVMTYWQQIGRCGRDGTPARAVWYAKSVVCGKDTDIAKQIKAQSVCVRQTVLDAFALSVAPSSRVKLSDKRVNCQATTKCDSCTCAYCTCCSHCRRQCRCRRFSDLTDAEQ